MKFNTHNSDPAININGTSLMGYCDDETTYDELVFLFGEPTDGDKYKIDAEWIIQFEDGTTATIYNYKNGKNYLKSEGDYVADMKGDDWHIGGYSKTAVDLVNETLAAHREWVKTNSIER